VTAHEAMPMCKLADDCTVVGQSCIDATCS
jgi:hypothetical protein